MLNELTPPCWRGCFSKVLPKRVSKIYKHGMDRFMEEMDIVRLMRTVRIMKVMTKLQFNKE